MFSKVNPIKNIIFETLDRHYVLNEDGTFIENNNSTIIHLVRDIFGITIIESEHIISEWLHDKLPHKNEFIFYETIKREAFYVIDLAGRHIQTAYNNGEHYQMYNHNSNGIVDVIDQNGLCYQMYYDSTFDTYVTLFQEEKKNE